MRTGFLLALPFVAISCAHAPTGPASPDTNASRIQFSGVEYRRLTGRALREAIVGATMNTPEIIVSGDNFWNYDRDSRTYWNGGHRGVPRIGTYSVTRDAVCHTLSGNSWCFTVYRNAQGDFVSVVVASQGAQYDRTPQRITLSPGARPYPFGARE
jgi:hypothetical protein